MANARSRTTPPRTESVRAKLPGPYDLEEFSLALQKFVARLQDLDVHSVERCSIYFTPLDGSGGQRVLTDPDGKPITILDV